MIREATLSDISSIMEIIRETIKELHSYGNYQWDDSYPTKKDFLEDINQGDLYVVEKDGNVAGFVCINRIEPVEYQGVNWCSNQEALVIHRMAVNRKYRKEGIGQKLVKHAEKLGAERGIKYLKTDTYSMNNKAQGLFKKCGYNYVGNIQFRNLNKDFYCYEKSIT